jgi:hypothetical protein
MLGHSVSTLLPWMVADDGDGWRVVDGRTRAVKTGSSRDTYRMSRDTYAMSRDTYSYVPLSFLLCNFSHKQLCST